jgi:synaptobrevin family protein YKT6
MPYSTDEFLSKHPRSEYANPSLPQRGLPLPQLTEYIKKYQDPSQADSIMKIQQELDQTKIVLYVWSCGD